MEIEEIAAICHEANRTLCALSGDSSQKSWMAAPDWQRESAIKGVLLRIQNPEAPISSQHEAWCADKIKSGWRYGNTKDEAKKTHPCLVDWDELPAEQRAKDHLFCGIVDALARYVKTDYFTQR